MWFLKYLTIIIYAIGLYTIAFYINFLEFSEWLLNKNRVYLNKSYDYIIGMQFATFFIIHKL